MMRIQISANIFQILLCLFPRKVTIAIPIMVHSSNSGSSDEALANKRRIRLRLCALSHKLEFYLMHAIWCMGRNNSQ